MRILFLINGNLNSAAGVRARVFGKYFPEEWKLKFKYRPQRKWMGVLPFILSAILFRPKIVYVMDTAYTGVLSGVAAKYLLSSKLVVDTGDAAYELAKSVGTYSSRQLDLIHWIETLAIQHSDTLVVRGSHHKEWLNQQGVNDVEFIPDGVENSFHETDFASTLHPKGSPFVVGMLGSMVWSEKYEMCYGWDIVEALAFLPDENIRAILIGDGDGKEKLESRACELGVEEKIKFVGSIPYKEIPSYLSTVDICISTQSNDLVGNVRTTGKLPLYLAAGKYVVSSSVGEAKRVLPGVGCLLPYEGVKDAEHPRRLAETFRVLQYQRDQIIAVGPLAKQVAKDNFDYEMLSKRIQTLLLSLND